MTYKCTKCEAPLQHGQRFCASCGQEHNWGAVQNSAPAGATGTHKKGLQTCGITAVIIMGLLMVTCVIALNSDPNTEAGDDAARVRSATTPKEPGPSTRSSPEPRQPTAEATASAIDITAVQLADEYDKNAVAADSKYEGKRVRITGKIGDIGKDVLDTSYLILKGENKGFVDIQCMFREEHEHALGQLSKGQEVTVEGEVAGETILNVIVRYCELK